MSLIGLRAQREGGSRGGPNVHSSFDPSAFGCVQSFLPPSAAPPCRRRRRPVYHLIPPSRQPSSPPISGSTVPWRAKKHKCQICFLKKATEIFYIPIYDQKNNILTLNILAFMFLAVQSTVEPEIGGVKVDETPKYYCADPR